jgi:hypothetical protein
MVINNWIYSLLKTHFFAIEDNNRYLFALEALEGNMVPYIVRDLQLKSGTIYLNKNINLVLAFNHENK